MCDYGCLESYLVPYAQRALNLLPKECVRNTIITSSSGLSVTLIPRDLDYVLQAFTSPELYLHIKQFWCNLLDSEDPTLMEYIAPIMEWFDHSCTFSVKKVAPLNNFGVGISVSPYLRSKIYHDIVKAINGLGEYGLVQGDPSLDNIGFNLDTQKFVLFDYDKACWNAPVSAVIRDIRKLETSLNFRTKFG